MIPWENLKKSATEHHYFKAYSLVCAYFKSMGMKILNKYFDGNEVHIGKELSEYLRLQAITVMLYTHKMISRDTYDNMLCISRIRNTRLIHGDITKMPSFEILEKILKPVDKIATCVKILNAKFQRMVITYD